MDRREFIEIVTGATIGTPLVIHEKYDSVSAWASNWAMDIVSVNPKESIRFSVTAIQQELVYEFKLGDEINLGERVFHVVGLTYYTYGDRIEVTCHEQ